MLSDNDIKKVLKESKTIAMVGVSSEKKGEDKSNLKRKPANVVMKYMQDFGYKVYPINPFAVGETINGATSGLSATVTTVTRPDVGPLATLDYDHNDLIHQPFKSTEFRISSAEFSDFIGKI